MLTYVIQPGTRCRRCNCVILAGEAYIGLNLDGCIVFIHVDTL